MNLINITVNAQRSIRIQGSKIVLIRKKKHGNKCKNGAKRIYLIVLPEKMIKQLCDDDCKE